MSLLSSVHLFEVVFFDGVSVRGLILQRSRSLGVVMFLVPLEIFSNVLVLRDKVRPISCMNILYGF